MPQLPLISPVFTPLSPAEMRERANQYRTSITRNPDPTHAVVISIDAIEQFAYAVDKERPSPSPNLIGLAATMSPIAADARKLLLEHPEDKDAHAVQAWYFLSTRVTYLRGRGIYNSVDYRTPMGAALDLASAAALVCTDYCGSPHGRQRSPFSVR